MKEIKSAEELIAHAKTARKRSGWIEDDEGQILWDAAASSDWVECFESGTKYGWSSLWIAMGLKDGVLIHTFDPVVQFQLDKDTNLTCHIKRYIEKFHIGVAPLLPNRLPGNALFFIDGDHSAEGVTRDWETVEPYLRSGDMVVFHDNYRKFPGVQALLESIALNSRYVLSRHDTQHGITTMKVL